MTVIAQKPAALSGAITEWQGNAANPHLLENRQGGTQLDISESHILDVYNQPGWFILDIGDEIFLVKINVADLRYRTAEERLRSESVGQGGRGTGQKFDLFYDRERILEKKAGRALKFEFFRLNTFVVQSLSERLFGESIAGLLSLDSQNMEEPDFANLAKLDSSSSALTIIPPKTMPNGEIDNRIDFDGAYGLYYREIFFHIPFLIANQLNANQKFAEAQQWYHYIFNPTAQEQSDDGNQANGAGSSKDRYWRYRPFRNLSLETLAEILGNEAALDAYRQDPFDPHAIARLRIIAYQKAVVMKYIDNLLDWGDYLFRQDTREDINEALLLYVLAYNLLGPRPNVKKVRKFEQIDDYKGVKAGNPQGIPDFLAQLNDAGTARQPLLRRPSPLIRIAPSQPASVFPRTNTLSVTGIGWRTGCIRSGTA